MAKQHLLLVDPDPKSLRVMEVSLKKSGFSVTTATDGRDALEKVQLGVPDLVLSDTRMPELDGFELCRTLKSDERFRGIPFVFLTGQKSVESKVRGLELGGDDYLTKPIYIKEVVTRVRMILQKVERDRQARRETKNGFAGSIAELGVVDLVQTFEFGRKTGTLTLTEDARTGTVWFRDGRVVDAELGRLLGEAAFYRMLNFAEGEFDVKFGPLERADRIELSTQGLLMEGMRRLDEWTRMLEALPPLESIFEIDYRLLADRLAQIPDEVNGLLRLFDGKRSLSRVVDDSDFDDLDALGIVSKLYQEGLIRQPGATEQVAAPAGRKPRIEEWLGASRQETPGPSTEAQEAPDASAAPTLRSVPLPEEPDAPGEGSTAQQPANVIVFAPRGRGANEDGLSEIEVEEPPAAEPPAIAAEEAPPPAPTAAQDAVDPRGAMELARQRFLGEWEKEEEALEPVPGLSWSPALPAAAPAPAVTQRAVPVPHNAPQAAPPAPAPAPTPSRDRVPVSEPVPAHPAPQAAPAVPLQGPPVFGGAASEPPMLTARERPGSTAAAAVTSAELEIDAAEPELPAYLSSHTPGVGDQDTFDGPESAPPPAPAPSPAPVTPSSAPAADEDRFFDSDADDGGTVDYVFEGELKRRRGGVWAVVGLGAIAAAAAVFVFTGEPKPQGDAPVQTVQAVPEVVVTQTEAPPNEEEAATSSDLAAAEAQPSSEPGAAAGEQLAENGAPAAPDVVGEPGTPPVLEAAAVPETSAPDAVQPAVAAQPAVPESVQPAAGEATSQVAPAVAKVPAAATGAPVEGDFDAILRDADRALKADRFKTAVTHYRRALAIRPDSVEARSGLGVSLVSSDPNMAGYREAVTLLEGAVKQRANDARAWLSLGMAYQVLGRDKQAAAPYRQYLSLEPNGHYAGEVRSALRQMGQ